MRDRSMWWGIAVLLAAAGLSHAGPVGPLTTFTAGTPAKASEVNANFSAVKTAVDDNASRITTLQSTVTPAGNIVLVPSTASAGNILKGTAPFIHNFGTSNTFIGVNAGNLTTTGVGLNTAIGVSALQRNTTGSANTASGFQALLSNTTGLENTASGSSALQSNTTGSSNTASGVNALVFNTTGNFNTASGARALTNNTTGFNNTASGADALLFNTTGGANTASGRGALQNNTTGVANTASGQAALFSNTTGTNNIAIGFNAGLSLTTGDNNIAIGNAGVAAEANTIRIGDVQTRAFIAGISGATIASGVAVLVNSSGQLGTTASSGRFKQDIADMSDTTSRLMRLRPVTFRYKPEHDDGSRLRQYGLIAEEVAAVYPGLVASTPDGQAQTVRYHFLAPMLLNEYQKQQRTIEAQTARIAELEKQNLEIAELKRHVARMASLLGRLEQAGMVANAGR
jgi:hypothetical protein